MNPLINQLYVARKNVLQMLETQGYNTKEYSYFSTVEVEVLMKTNQLDMLLELDDSYVSIESPKKKVYIRFMTTGLIGKGSIRSDALGAVIKDLFESETDDPPVLDKATDTLYVIVMADENESLIQYLKHIWETTGIFVVVQNIDRLQYNLLEHEFVPKHRILKPSEVKKVLDQFGSLDQMPMISRFDPVAKAICMRPGQLCHILRSSKTTIRADYWRVCVNLEP